MGLLSSTTPPNYQINLFGFMFYNAQFNHYEGTVHIFFCELNVDKQN